MGLHLAVGSLAVHLNKIGRILGLCRSICRGHARNPMKSNSLYENVGRIMLDRMANLGCRIEALKESETNEGPPNVGSLFLCSGRGHVIDGG